MRKFYLLLFALSLQIFSLNAQSPDFIAPLDIPLILSGNFAELRGDHFHSGLDFKTKGITGLKVRSIDEAYVSRIKIQTNGYGNSIYLNHPNGFTSVYGHLSAYNTIIDEYVKNYQYKNESHTLDIYPKKNELLIKKGEVIAYSGNTGSSSGPHLHFEIRKTSTQHTLNALNFPFKVEDNIKPRLYNLYTYSITEEQNRRRLSSREKYQLAESNGAYKVLNNEIIEIDSKTGFGLEVFDFLNGAPNSCGIYTLELFVNGEALYSFKTDEFSFAESRYINSHLDYDLKFNEKKLVHRLFQLPNIRLSMEKYQKDFGILKSENDSIYNVEIKVSDVAGNKTSLNFKARGKQTSSFSNETMNSESLMLWDQINSIENHLFKIKVPGGSLYEDTKITYSRISDNTKICEWIHTVGEPSVPLHLGASLSLNISQLDSSLVSKACILSLNSENAWDYQGGNLENGDWINTKIYNFGSFIIDVDTIAPVIKRQESEKSIKFTVTDNLSGIDEYKGYIDNKWALFVYDPKNDLLQYVFDEKRIAKNSNHEIELYISDKKGNTALYHNSFYW